MRRIRDENGGGGGKKEEHGRIKRHGLIERPQR